MVSLIVSLTVILLPSFGWTQAKSGDKCNESCQTKSYSITRDGLIGCSGANCLMEGSFKAHLINGETVLNINLIGYDFASLKEGTFSVILTNGDSQSKYSCFTTAFGASDAQVTIDGVSYVNGSTQINQKNLYCSWYMVYTSDIWPKFDGVKTTFQSDRNMKIMFEVDSKVFAIAPSPVDLPIYHMQFFQCCYKVYGSDVYQLVVDQNDKQTNFFMQTFDSSPYILSASLADYNGKQLIFDCYQQTKSIKGYLKTEALVDDISSQLMSTSFIEETQCSWSLPLIIKGSFSTYDTTNGVYDLEISADSEIVFTENNIPLKGFASKTISSLILILSTFVLHFIAN